jgi:hypothetical protein
MAVVVQNPEGPVFLGVSPDNPYKEIPSEEDGDEKEQVAFGETVFLIPNRYVQDALDLERHARTVRVFTMIDCFMNMFNFIATGYLASVLLSFISILGYQGAVKYDRTKLVGYMSYQVLLTFARYAILVVAVVNKQYDNVTYVALPLMALLQTYIAWYVIRFYRMLPNFSARYTQVD